MRSFLIKTILSLGSGTLFVWLAIRKVEWEKVEAAFRQVEPHWAAVYVLLIAGLHLLRVLRWGVLLRPLGPVAFPRLFRVASVGYMALMVMPLRLGEFARPFLLADRVKMRISSVFATVVIERLIDSLAMTLLLVSILFSLGMRIEDADQLAFWGWLLTGLFLLILLFLFWAHFKPEATIRFFSRWLRFLPERISARLCSMLESFIHGLQVLPNWRLFGPFLVYTLVIWVLSGLGIWMMFFSFPGLANLGALEAFTSLAVLCVGLMIPAGPGMVGNFHYFMKLGLSLFLPVAVLESSGVAYVFLVHALQLVVQVGLGLPFLFSPDIQAKRIFFVLDKRPGNDLEDKDPSA